MNQTVTRHLLSDRWYPLASGIGWGRPATLPTQMPAPLGKVPTRKMPDVQVFGRDDSPDTRAALRFFRERLVVVHYSELRKRPIAPGELQALHGAPGRPRTPR